MKRNINDQLSWIGDQWNRFWFTPSESKNLVPARCFVCAVAVVWFATGLFDVGWWFGADGWNASDVARRLSVTTEGTWPSRFRVSPLWSTSQGFVFRIWAAAGALLAVLAMIGIGGRAVMLATFLSALFLAQRLTWATGALEPALVAALGYLVIDPGRPLGSRGEISEPPRWSAGLTIRLLQVHVWILIAAALVSQLANVTWWRGDAVWWLAATGHSNIFQSTEPLHGHILLINALTHGISLCTLIAVLTLWTERLRWIGLVCGCLLGVTYALVGDQVLYGLIIIALLLGGWHADWLPRPENSKERGTH